MKLLYQEPADEVVVQDLAGAALKTKKLKKKLTQGIIELSEDETELHFTARGSLHTCIIPVKQIIKVSSLHLIYENEMSVFLAYQSETKHSYRILQKNGKHALREITHKIATLANLRVDEGSSYNGP